MKNFIWTFCALLVITAVLLVARPVHAEQTAGWTIKTSASGRFKEVLLIAGAQDGSRRFVEAHIYLPTNKRDYRQAQASIDKRDYVYHAIDTDENYVTLTLKSHDGFVLVMVTNTDDGSQNVTVSKPDGSLLVASDK